MKIVLIGSGNVAQSLGKMLVQKGHTILQVMNRTAESARELAKELNAGHTTQHAEINPDADLYIVALADKAIPELMLKWRMEDKLVVHTAGTVPQTALMGITNRTGILYPLQSLRGTIPVSGVIPFLIQASLEEDLLVLQELVHSLGASCQVVNDHQRLRMHVNAVWVNNFPNLMYSIAFQLCKENKLSFELLLPLIKETFIRLEPEAGASTGNPFLWQTGPAMREDQNTIRKHLDIMNPHPDWKDLYQQLTEEIISFKSQLSE
ncbi:Rossmann-like and DUF2520 domain-containing protein [Flavihumibacter sp. UBA7668]|uniref:Rossmann-like and DUF2520 domain-containing protein n=1 Tax=Flavihumibacter sp. UBA7668 TaxID=1946542 RepID=UPI0025C56A7A|nr:F420-dependent NADP oxidoreductase [Flavihumibacter sp. UBA7668]